MKQATLYTAKKENVVLTDLNYIRQYRHNINFQDLTRIRNSDDVLLKSEVEHIQLPVELYRWSNGKEILAAFDEELREIIGCSQEKFKRDVQTATDRRVNQQYQALLLEKSELETLKGMNLWQRLGWAILKNWRNK